MHSVKDVSNVDQNLTFDLYDGDSDVRVIWSKLL